MSKVAKIKPEKKGTELKSAERTRYLSPFDEMDRYFEQFFPQRWLRSFGWDWPRHAELLENTFSGQMPRVDVIDREKEIVVRAEVAGVKKDNLHISLTDRRLTIKGETKQEDTKEKGDYYRRETAQGAFSRTVTLPSEVDSDNARASFKDGLLEITVPKVQQAQRKTVPVE